MVKDQFSIPSLLCLGALLQASLFLALPARWAVLPTAAFALHGILSAALQTLFPSLNQFNKDVVPGRVAGQLPNATYNPSQPSDKPLFGPKASGEQLVVFHLGLRYNHPLGMFCPGAQELKPRVVAMYRSLEVEARKYGCLGNSVWRGAGRESANTSVHCFYFRSVEGLHAFAHDPVHREAWDWFYRWRKETGYRHIGIYHETFRAGPGDWESLYVDMPPTLLGGTNVGVRNAETGDEEYVVPLVDADHTRLRSQYGRMGRTKAGEYQLDA
jgi:hypothetical protein